MKDENPPSQPINETQRCDTQTQREDIAEDDFVQQFFDTAYGDTAARAAHVGPPSEWKSMLVEAFGGKLFRSLYTLPDGNVGREFINTLAELKEKRVSNNKIRALHFLKEEAAPKFSNLSMLLIPFINNKYLL